MNTKKSDKEKWQAESDAYTMAKYQEIVNDKSRMQRAIKAAKVQMTDLNKRVSAMQHVVNTKPSSRSKHK